MLFLLGMRYVKRSNKKGAQTRHSCLQTDFSCTVFAAGYKVFNSCYKWTAASCDLLGFVVVSFNVLFTL